MFWILTLCTSSLHMALFYFPSNVRTFLAMSFLWWLVNWITRWLLFKLTSYNIIDQYYVKMLSGFHRMYVHQCLLHFQGTSHQLFLKKRYLVTLRYCEISVTEYPLVWVCFNILFLSLPLTGLYAHTTKSSFSVCFLFIFCGHCLTICCVLGSSSCKTCVLNLAAIYCRGDLSW